MIPVKLVCPNGHPPAVSTRRGMVHAPCMHCAMEGRGVVWRQVERPPEAPRSEPPEVERPEPAPARAAQLAPSPAFVYECARDGHRFTGGVCHFCLTPAPLNPAALVAIAVVLALATLLWPGRARAEEWRPPDAADVAMLVTAQTLVAVDVLQTLDLKNHPDFVFGELNPLLGSHPSDLRIIGMAAGGAVLTTALWYALPPSGRWVVPAVVVVLETVAVISNAQAGLVVRF